MRVILINHEAIAQLACTVVSLRSIDLRVTMIPCIIPCIVWELQHFAVRLSQGIEGTSVVINVFKHRLHPVCFLVFVHKYVVTTHMHDNTN